MAQTGKGQGSIPAITVSITSSPAAKQRVVKIPGDQLEKRKGLMAMGERLRKGKFYDDS